MSITPDHLRDLARIQHARYRGEKALEETPAWQAAERIEELERQLASKESEIRALSGPRRMALHNDDGETYRTPPGGWTCFHCGEVLETEHEARAHFGGDPQATPICQELALEAEIWRLAAEAANQLLEATRDERDALAAHLERWKRWLSQDAEDDVGDWMDQGWSIAHESPTTSLARRDALKQAEALVWLLDEWVACRKGPAPWPEFIGSRIDELRRQATEGQPS